MAEQAKKNEYLVPGSIILAGIIIGLAIYFGVVSALGGGQGNGGAIAGVEQAPSVNIADVDIEGDPFIGDKDAPVTMAYWFDYQCPFCHKFDEESMPQLVKDYVETGKVKVVFKDYQFLGPDSHAAALVARAVWDVAPDQFYDWYQAVFHHQDAENAGWGSRDDVLAVTKDILGAEKAQKVEDLSVSNESKYKDKIAADRAEGSKFGIGGTPGMIIGKTLISGAQPYYVVKEALQAQLDK